MSKVVAIMSMSLDGFVSDRNDGVAECQPAGRLPSHGELERHFTETGDQTGADLLVRLRQETSLRVNERGIPSLWYMALLDGHYFFDGFGFAQYRDRFPNWTLSGLDEREKMYPPNDHSCPTLSGSTRKSRRGTTWNRTVMWRTKTG